MAKELLQYLVSSLTLLLLVRFWIGAVMETILAALSVNLRIAINKVTVLILLVLSDTFDTTDHKELLTCWQSLVGIVGLTLEWLYAYLSERT